MKAVLSHPIISSFLKHYRPSEHINCLQAVSLVGISLLKGKIYTPEHLHRLSTRLSHNRLSVKKSKGKPKPKTGKRLVAKSSSQQKVFKKPVHKRQQKRVSNHPRREKEWNLKLYGSSDKNSNTYQLPPEESNSNIDQFDIRIPIMKISNN